MTTSLPHSQFLIRQKYLPISNSSELMKVCHNLGTHDPVVRRIVMCYFKACNEISDKCFFALTHLKAHPLPEVGVPLASSVANPLISGLIKILIY
jgi:hypothetical protein